MCSSRQQRRCNSFGQPKGSQITVRKGISAAVRKWTGYQLLSWWWRTSAGVENQRNLFFIVDQEKFDTPSWGNPKSGWKQWNRELDGFLDSSVFSFLSSLLWKKMKKIPRTAPLHWKSISWKWSLIFSCTYQLFLFTIQLLFCYAPYLFFFHSSSPQHVRIHSVSFYHLNLHSSLGVQSPHFSNISTGSSQVGHTLPSEMHWKKLSMQK